MKHFYTVFFLLLCCIVAHATDYVAITEVLYDDTYENDSEILYRHTGEFVELYNAADESVDMAGWQLQTLSPAQTYTFPSSTIIPAREVLLVCYGNKYGTEDLTDKEKSEGWTDFHVLYNLSPSTCPVLH